jgi:hypothetical protein
LTVILSHTFSLPVGLVNQELENLLATNPKPSVIVLHVGADDISSTKSIMLRQALREMMDGVISLLPETCLIWSEMISRLRYPGAVKVGAIEKERRRNNICVCRYALSMGGRTILHRDIDPTTPWLYTDGIHLADAGVDVFLNDLCYALELFYTTEAKLYPYLAYPDLEKATL